MSIWSAEIKEVKNLYDSIRGQFPDLEKELKPLITSEDSNVVLLYSRRCLEIIITELCEIELKRPRKTEPLKGIIDKLNSEEKVPSNIITSMHSLNSLSTFGTHPKDFDPEQVKPVLNNLSTIIKWYLKYKYSQAISESREETIKHESLYHDDARNPVHHQIIKNKPAIFISGVLITFILLILILNFFNIFKEDKFKNIRDRSGRISIAVMPFQNMTNDSTWNDWQDGIKDEVINYLTEFNEELDVKQTGSINGILQSKGLTNYSSLTPGLVRSISNNLNAKIFLLGSIKQTRDKIRVNTLLIDSKTEEVLKSFQIEYPAKVDTIFSLIDSLSVTVKDFLIFSKIKKEGTSEFEYYSSTNSPEAYKYFRYGNNALGLGDITTATDWYLRAFEIDTNFAAATNMLSLSYLSQGLFKKGKECCLRNYKKREHLPLRMQLYVNYFYAVFFQTPKEEIKYFKQVLDYDDQVPSDHAILGFSYNKIYQYDKAIYEIEKAFEIYKKWGSTAFGDYNYTELGNAYHKNGDLIKEQELYREAEQHFPNDRDILNRQAILSISQGDTISAKKYLNKYITILKDNSVSEASIEENLAGIYFEAGNLDKAEEYYRNAISLEPQNPWLINNLAYFLIDNNRDITEGLLLVDKALEISPDNYNYLHTKGWGLYKQDKYKEAYGLLKRSWDLRMENAIYNHEAYLHLEAAKKAVA